VDFSYIVIEDFSESIQLPSMEALIFFLFGFGSHLAVQHDLCLVLVPGRERDREVLLPISMATSSHTDKL
jgi:hypothetical protein